MLMTVFLPFNLVKGGINAGLTLLFISRLSSALREKKAQLIAWLEALGLRIHISDGEFQTVLGLIGDTAGSISTLWRAWRLSTR